MQCTIKLPEEQVNQLEELAAREHRSVDEVVQLAVGDYLARHRTDHADWARRFDAFVSEVRSRIPPEMTSEEIEAEITANWEEYRAERSGQPARDADAGGR